MAKSNHHDVNPFFIYVLSFSFALLVYQLNWSSLYPELSLSLLGFLFATFIVSFAIGIYVKERQWLIYRDIKNTINVHYCVIAITFGYILDFLYSGQIPFFAILNNSNIDYQKFGIPTFHVVLTTFTSFFTVYLFNCYISEKKKIYIVYSMALLFIFPLLIFNRGMILINASSIFFVYLFSLKGNRLKTYIKLIFVVLIGLLGFGTLGNVRTSNQLKENGSAGANDIILNISGARPDFINSNIPKEYFWAYLYTSSPLANLQFTVDHDDAYHDDVAQLLYYFNSELNFDFISKRIFDVIEYKPLWIKQIAPFLTVGTIFGKSFVYLGYAGMLFTFLFLMCISLVYMQMLKPWNNYFVTGIAILNTLILFSIFDNMIAFSGLSFQLIFPIILGLKFKNNSL